MKMKPSEARKHTELNHVLPIATGIWQVGIGVALLSIGILVYVVDRNVIPFFAISTSDIVSINWSLTGRYSDWVPSFCHSAGICLLSAGILGCGRRVSLTICATWAVVHSILELSQMDELASSIFGGVTLAGDNGIAYRYLEAYSKNGVFDVSDLLAATTGSALAYLVLKSTCHHKSRPSGAKSGSADS